VSKKLPAIRVFTIEGEVGWQAPAERAQVFQESLAPRLAHYKKFALVRDMNLDIIAFPEIERFNHGSRNPDGKAIAPFRNLHAGLRRIYNVSRVYLSQIAVKARAACGYGCFRNNTAIGSSFGFRDLDTRQPVGEETAAPRSRRRRYRWIMPELETGRMVILNTLPPDLVQRLPEEDQAAIRSIIGRPVKLAGYSFGQAELEFVDGAGDSHNLWVEPSLLQAAS
jgi:hypothetical protein